MLNNKGFDLWADGYDKTVGISDEENTYHFCGYKGTWVHFQTIMRDEMPLCWILDSEQAH